MYTNQTVNWRMSPNVFAFEEVASNYWPQLSSTGKRFQNKKFCE